MLSPNTPPGTPVLCINTRDWFFADPRDNPQTSGDLDGLTEGRVYVVRCFRPDPDLIGGFAVYVEEIYRGVKNSMGDELGFAP